jgi:hypothetical protein
MKYIVICQDESQFNAVCKHYNKEWDASSIKTHEYGVRIIGSEADGYSRLEFYQAGGYRDYKYISFPEWIQLTNPKSTTKSTSNMKYVVEVNNHTEATVVRNSVGATYNNSITSFPWCINGITGNMSSPEYYKVENPVHGPVLTFKVWAAMLGIEPKPQKTIKLTNDYKAIINYSKEVVEVGCQTIPFSKVEELAKLIKE